MQTMMHEGCPRSNSLGYRQGVLSAHTRVYVVTATTAGLIF
jgi:hypothetical protein